MPLPQCESHTIGWEGRIVMMRREQDQNWNFGVNPRVVGLALAIVFVQAVTTAPAMQAQTFQVISSFSYTAGTVPMAGLTLDRAGNLIGTTRTGGDLYGGYYCMLYQYNGCGTVFKLTRHGSSWLYSTLYSSTPMTEVIPRPR